MPQALTLHPESQCAAVNHILVEIIRPSLNKLALRYRVSGEIEALSIPATTAPERADGLWERTCFEAFLSTGNEGYHELNFSPSTEWAAYRFEHYRSGMRPANVCPPAIESRSNVDCYEMQVAIDLDQLGAGPWQLALSAVIEETNGRKSYWALRHPPGKPDFHHPDSFVCELP